VDGGGTITAVVFVALYLGAAIYMIYDPETVGSTTGFIGHSAITKPTPPQLVRFAGCAMLALPFGLLAGTVFGLAQQLRGAHFISHDVASLAVCWGVACAVEACFGRSGSVPMESRA